MSLDTEAQKLIDEATASLRATVAAQSLVLADLAAKVNALSKPPAPTPVPTPPPVPADPKVARLTWTEPLDGPGLAGRNWVMPAGFSDYSPTGLRPDFATFPAWTWFDRSDTPSSNPTRYAASDSRLGRQSWCIEMEAGATPPVPRRPGTKSLRIYTDAAARSWLDADLSRADVMDRAPLISMGFGEGKTLWLGWSDYWTAIDRGGPMTLLQFRDQPTAQHLVEQGINVASEAAARGITVAQLDANINGTGPVVSLVTVAADNQVRYQVQIRIGTIYTHKPVEWSLPANQVWQHPEPIAMGEWRDIVVRMKSSQGPDGRFSIWIRKAGEPFDVARPDFDFRGATEYRYPVIQGKQVRAVPEIRQGHYRWHRRRTNALAPFVLASTDPSRYCESFMGPRRWWVGDGDEGMAKVRPDTAD